MTIRLPRVWPPCVYLTAALVLHAATVGAVFYWCVNVRGMRPDQTDAVFARSAPPALFVAAVAYAVFRVWAFHPSLRPGYRQWLAQTPWRHPAPLPLGPVHLTAADAALLGGAFVAAWPFYGVSLALEPIQAFLAVYLVLLLAALLVTAEWAAAYGIWFGLGAMVLARDSVWPYFAAAGVAYAAGWIGLRRPLTRFPRELPEVKLVGLTGEQFMAQFSATRACAWPFGYLAPGAAPVMTVRGHALALAALGGWTAYVVGAVIPWPGHIHGMSGHFFLHSVLSPVGFIQISLYHLHQHRPPINLAGRMFTGRWIVPGYDQIFVAPLLSLAVMMLAPFGVLCWELNQAIAFPAAFAFALFILLTAGPSRRRWFLTGRFRVRPGFFGHKPPLWV